MLIGQAAQGKKKPTCAKRHGSKATTQEDTKEKRNRLANRSRTTFGRFFAF